jgi:hypothetical protein
VTSQLAERRAAWELTAGRGRGPASTLTALPQAACRCPVPVCGHQIDPSRLMCRGHWYVVDRKLRDRVWATWRSGEGALSPEHLDAVRRATTGMLSELLPLHGVLASHLADA